MKEKTLETEKLKSCSTRKRCSDFDDECIDVVNHTRCWLGNHMIGKADGYCPFIDNSN